MIDSSHPILDSRQASRVLLLLARAWGYLLCVAVLSNNGCSRDRRAGQKESLPDSLQVTLVDSRTESAAHWTSTPTFATAELDSVQLHSAFDAVFLEDTSLVIASGGDVFRLTREGTFHSRMARGGDGPGEFRLLFRLGLAGDGSMFGSDLRSGRFTQLQPGGTPGLIIPRLSSDEGGREVDPVVLLADGRILATYWQWRPNRGELAGITAAPFERDPVPLLVFNQEGQQVDTLGIWPGLERARVGLSGDESRLPVPFARSAVVDGRRDATVIGVTDSLDLTLFQGTTRRLRLVGPAVPRRVADADLTEWWRTLLRERPDVGAMVQEAEEGIDRVPSLPGIGGVVLDDASNIWVGDFVLGNQATRNWRIFSPEGELLGRLELPAYHDAFMPSRTELLDVYANRIAVLREDPSGELIIEVRTVQRQ